MLTVDFRNARSRAANYIALCDNLADDYPYGTPHGVQKDAIQNAMDARRRGRLPTCVEFTLMENGRGTFITVTDWNTTGLTGPVLRKEEYEEDDLPEDYHWARFESFAFHKEDPNAIGARGQGKFILLHASEDYMVFYDTLRDDGVYRLGVTKATKIDCPMKHWEGEEARAQLRAQCGLIPLANVGTRIIIVNPKGEVIRELIDGELEKAIQETWFRAIEKQQLVVTLRYRGHYCTVGSPAPYPLQDADTEDYKVWLVENGQIRLSRGERFRVKRFHAVYRSSGTFPEPLQGIAVIQNGMKIQSLEMEKTNAPVQARERVTGFIEFDAPLDREIRKGENQHSNHYRLNWRSRTCHGIKEYIVEQLEEFSRRKWNLGVDPRERRKRNQIHAEEWAMKELMRVADDLDLFGAKGGKGKKRRRKNNGRKPPPPGKELAVSIEDFGFPDPAIEPRVNWGQQIEGITVYAHNVTRGSREVSLRIRVMLGDSELYQPLEEQRFTLKPASVKSFGPFSVAITKERFPEPGQYRLNAALFDTRTGQKLDHMSKRFWVEEDPPLRQPFLTQGYPGRDNDHRQWFITGSINNSPMIYYNVKHPAYQEAEENPDRQKEYLFEVLLQAAMAFILDRPNKDDGSPDFHPLLTEAILGKDGDGADREEIAYNAYREVVKYLSEVRWRRHGGL